MQYTNALSTVFYIHMSCTKRFHRTETFDYYDGFAWSTNIFKYYNVERASRIRDFGKYDSGASILLSYFLEGQCHF